MSYYYEVSLFNSDYECEEVYTTTSKAKSLAICRRIVRKYPSTRFIVDKWYIEVQKIDNDKWSDEYGNWVDIWEYDIRRKELI